MRSSKNEIQPDMKGQISFIYKINPFAKAHTLVTKIEVLRNKICKVEKKNYSEKTLVLQAGWSITNAYRLKIC